MKILYAIQGTGNGHVCRAREIYRYLERRAEVDYLISGDQVDIALPFQIDHRARGMSLYFGKRGSVNISKTIRKNAATRIRKEISDLPIMDYDLVINDFEPISAWAARKKGVRCVALSHQSALLSDQIPRPARGGLVGRTILDKYAPADQHVGIHFERYEQSMYTPIIRSDIRNMIPSNNGHVTVYLPAYDDKHIIKVLKKVGDVQWEVFSKHGKHSYETSSIKVRPIHREQFAESLIRSHGVLCGAGFETPSEALFLGKRLMVIPMKNQYEQMCNAAALSAMGVSCIPVLSSKYANRIWEWFRYEKPVKKDYPDETESIVNTILDAV